ncbi:MAG: hypothetical protein WA705_28680 [Candidatus Ozemobacteraceae bacterium]
MTPPELMSKRFFKTVLCAFLALFSTFVAWAITPTEVFEDGRRAFALGHYRDARERFREFGKTWPAHPLNDRALWYLTLSEIRMETEENHDANIARLASFTVRAKHFQEKLPEADLNELSASIELLRFSEGGGPLASSGAILKLSPEVLAHLLARGWLPVPENAPLETLSWASAWEAQHAASEPFTLRARLELMRAKALWKIALSPLPREASIPLLKRLGVWPVTGALLRSLRKAFLDGDLDIKREAALLGLSVETLGSLEKPVKSGSAWLRYLRERGTCDQESWCPR